MISWFAPVELLYAATQSECDTSTSTAFKLTGSR